MGVCWSIQIKAESPFFYTGEVSKNVSREGNENSSCSKNSSTSIPQTPRSEGEILLSTNLKSFTFSELKSATRNFRPDSVLGEGGFGSVFKGWVEEQSLAASKPGIGMVVAVKRLNQDGFQGHKEWLGMQNGKRHFIMLIERQNACPREENSTCGRQLKCHGIFQPSRPSWTGLLWVSSIVQSLCLINSVSTELARYRKAPRRFRCTFQEIY